MGIFRKRLSPSSYFFFVGAPPPPGPKKRRLLLPAIIVLLALPLLTAGALYLWVRAEIPSPDAVLNRRPSLTTLIYGVQGGLIGRFYAERRRLLPIKEVSLPMRRAIVAVEDERFYRHFGVDPIGVLRAALRNLRSWTAREGASTLTQQLVRLLVLGRERTFKRKVIEAFTALQIETTLGKDEILERYLNLVYFGRGAYGVAAAARTYFDKTASLLTVAEGAFLAGLVQAPGRFRPFTDPKPSLARRAHVLRRMAAAGFLAPDEARRLAKAPLRLHSPAPIRAGGHFLEHVRRRLEETYGSSRLYRGGLRVHTTLDLGAQLAAEAAVRRGVERLVRRRWPGKARDGLWKGPEAALLALDARTGAVRAMVGGVNFQKSRFNRTIQALRQPGSAFKPIVYAAAINMGFTPVDALLDAPVVLKGGPGREAWKPQNYARNFQGRVFLRDALAESRNTATVRLARALGVGRVIEFARRLGIRSPVEPTLASALGSSVITMRELVAAYAVFANGGLYNAPFAIERVEEAGGRILFQHEAAPLQSIRPEVAYVITHMLKGAVERGTARGAAVLDRPIAGKTGTTNYFRDNWFIGYSPGMVAGVWLGFDLPRSLGPGESGGRNAVPIFVDFFREAMKGTPAEDFVPPPGVEFVRIERETGLLADWRSRRADFEVFIQGSGPTRFADSAPRRPGALFRAEGLRPGSSVPAGRR